jgi:hypothetical protein
MRSAERIKPPKESRRGAREAEGDFDEQYQNNGYSKKGSHKHRSEANDSRKISRRR